MPYAIKEINTGKFFDYRTIDKTRTFNSTRAAHSCREYNAALHHLVEVEVVEVPGKQPIRQGTWLTERDFIAEYGSIHWKPKDVLTLPQCPWIFRVRAYPYHHMDPQFQVKGKEVYQLVHYTSEDPRTPFGHKEKDVPTPKMVLVYPNRPQHYHIY